jgi:hypothetical protein
MPGALANPGHDADTTAILSVHIYVPPPSSTTVKRRQLKLVWR